MFSNILKSLSIFNASKVYRQLNKRQIKVCTIHPDTWGWRHFPHPGWDLYKHQPDERRCAPVRKLWSTHTYRWGELTIHMVKPDFPMSLHIRIFIRIKTCSKSVTNFSSHLTALCFPLFSFSLQEHNKLTAQCQPPNAQSTKSNSAKC